MQCLLTTNCCRIQSSVGDKAISHRAGSAALTRVLHGQGEPWRQSGLSVSSVELYTFHPVLAGYAVITIARYRVPHAVEICMLHLPTLRIDPRPTERPSTVFRHELSAAV